VFFQRVIGEANSTTTAITTPSAPSTSLISIVADPMPCSAASEGERRYSAVSS